MHTHQRLDQDSTDFPGVSLRGFTCGPEFPSWLPLALQDHSWFERSGAGKAYARLTRRYRYDTRIPVVSGNNSTRPFTLGLQFCRESLILSHMLLAFRYLADLRTAAGLTHRGP